MPIPERKQRLHVSILMAACVARTFAVCVPQTAGPPSSARLKVWSYETGECLLELFRVVDLAEQRSWQTRKHKFVLVHLPRWQSWWASSGVLGEEAITFAPSEYAQREKAARDAVAFTALPFTHQEYVVSMRGAITILLHACAFNPHSQAKRLAAKQTLRAMLFAGLPTQMDALRQRVLPHEALGHCSVGADANGICAHLQDSWAALGDGDAINVDVLVSFLAHCSIQEAACPATRQALRTAVAFLTETLKSAVLEKGTGDVALLRTDDPTRVNKWRRIDEDVRGHVVRHGVVTAGSSSAYLRSLGGASAKSGSRWEEKELLCAQSAAWLTAASARCLHVAVDGRRLGAPAKEHEVYAVYEPTTNVAWWCQPVVRA